MPEPTRSERAYQNFWDWVQRTYGSKEVEIIARMGDAYNAVWQHYTQNIFETQWDEPEYEGPLTMQGLRAAYPGFSDDVLRIWLADPSRIPSPGTLSRTRPQFEKFGINETDWLVLTKLSMNPQKVIAEIDKWVSTGYINEYQARDIYDEAMGRAGQAEAQLLSTGYTAEEWPAEYAKQQAERERVRKAIERERYDERVRRFPLSTHFPKTEPFRDYGPALEKMRGEFAEEMPPTERWRDWFRAKYPRLIEQFEGQVPEKERREKGWREWLQERKPEIREQWWGLGPYGRGERPTTQAPRVTTVRF